MMMTQVQKHRFAEALERVAGDESTLRMLAEIAAEDAPEVLGRLKQQISQKECDDAARTAHTLKGMFSTFETGHPVSEMQALIDAGRNGNAAELTATMDELSPQLDALFEEICELSKA